MLYSEFVDEYNESEDHKYKLPTADEYHHIIEPIYVFHPANFDKGEIVALYEIGGLAIMNCLLGDANTAELLERDKIRIKQENVRLESKLDRMIRHWAPNNR